MYATGWILTVPIPNWNLALSGDRNAKPQTHEARRRQRSTGQGPYKLRDEAMTGGLCRQQRSASQAGHRLLWRDLGRPGALGGPQHSVTQSHGQLDTAL